MFKCQIKRWLYLSVNVMSTKLLKYWGWDHQFTWSSKPREGLAIVRQRRYLHFSFLTKSIGPVPTGPRNRTRDLPLCSRVRHRLSYSPAADLATERKRYSQFAAQPLVKPRSLYATHVNRKWGLLPFSMPCRWQICIAKFLFFYKDDLPREFQPSYCLTMQKVHFRLTSVAHKRCCLSSLITLTPLSVAGISIAKQMRK